MDKSSAAGAKRRIGLVYNDSIARGVSMRWRICIWIIDQFFLSLRICIYINELYLLGYCEIYYPRRYRATWRSVFIAGDAHFAHFHFGKPPGHAAYACTYANTISLAAIGSPMGKTTEITRRFVR